MGGIGETRMRISDEKLGEILAGLGVAAGPRETLSSVTARRLSAMTVAEAESLVTELRELREALAEIIRRDRQHFSVGSIDNFTVEERDGPLGTIARAALSGAQL
jgi:hypothetical protein